MSSSYTHDLQAFLAKLEGGTGAVDLLKIGQNFYQQHASTSKKSNKHISGNYRVAIDIEDCLDRFYGGYYSDWACGGQWNRAYQFVQLLANAFNNSQIEVIAFFDGTLKQNKKLTFEQSDFRKKTTAALKHIRMIGTPPPKIWWLPPSGIRTTLRNALRSINIQVAQTVNDHTMEIIEYYHDHKLDAILGLHPDYIIANTSKYFSSHDLRLSYKGSLETREFLVSKLLSSLSLTADHLPFVAVFLGGYILIDDIKLKKIHDKLKIDPSLDYDGKIRKIAEIVRNSPTTDIDEFIKHLNLSEFAKEIKETAAYYQHKEKFSSKKIYVNKKKAATAAMNQAAIPTQPQVEAPPVPLASETNENDEIARKILDDVNSLVNEDSPLEESTAILGSTSSSSSSAGTTPTEAVKLTSAATSAGVTGNNKANKNSKEVKKIQTAYTLPPTTAFVYTLPMEVLKTSLNRHQRGIMDARIYPLLTRKEIILPQILEDEKYREIPSVHLFYRPARQMIYAILFNLYHQKYLCSKTPLGGLVGGGAGDGSNKKSVADKKQQQQNQLKIPEVQISEWLWSPTNEYKKPELVSAQPLPWAVPTIQRLWFGLQLEDKQRRMRAFLTIMRSDSPLMLNRGYVPQHMLVMACVLRYIVTSPDRNILTRPELDAFLATAFSPQLPLVEYTQELVLPGVHLRGVYLATLFMQGVETSSLANDACGVPLPWTMTNPWLFFDGKLFHLKLKMSAYVSTLRELCDDHIEIVLKIERFRKAILEDVEHFLLPAGHVDPMYCPGFLPQPTLPVSYNKIGLHQLAVAAASSANGTTYYNQQTQLQAPYFQATQSLLGRAGLSNLNSAVAGRNLNQAQQSHQHHRGFVQGRPMGNQSNRRGYQLKVGGIVTGSWATAAAAAAAAAHQSGGGLGSGGRALIGPPGNRLNRTAGMARYAINNRPRNVAVNPRLHRLQPNVAGGSGLTNRSITRAYGNKVVNNRNRNNKKRKDNRKVKSGDENKETKDDNEKKTSTSDDGDEDDIEKKSPKKTDPDNLLDKIKHLTIKPRECTVELQNGTTVLASELIKDVTLGSGTQPESPIKQNHKSPIGTPIKSGNKIDVIDSGEAGACSLELSKAGQVSSKVTTANISVGKKLSTAIIKGKKNGTSKNSDKNDEDLVEELCGEVATVKV